MGKRGERDQKVATRLGLLSLKRVKLSPAPVESKQRINVYGEGEPEDSKIQNLDKESTEVADHLTRNLRRRRKLASEGS